MPHKVYREGFRISVGPRSLRIEAIDYHASPLILDEAGLRELGLSLAGKRDEAGIEPSPPRQLGLFRRWRRRPGS